MVITLLHRGSVTLSASTLIYDYVMMRPESGKCVFMMVLLNMLQDFYTCVCFPLNRLCRPYKKNTHAIENLY